MTGGSPAEALELTAARLSAGDRGVRPFPGSEHDHKPGLLPQRGPSSAPAAAPASQRGGERGPRNSY